MRNFTLAISAAALMAASGTAAYAHNHGKMPEGDMTRAQAQQHAETRFAEMDVNNDGVINAADRQARLGQKFDTMDSNSDGMISRDEFMAAHAEKAGKGHMGKRMGKRGHGMSMIMKMGDTNQDGQVTKDEFIAAALARFDKADTNNDGIVTPEERKAAMKAMHEEWRGKNKGE